ncbi:hypothetical protein ABT160_35410 [Streptomyces sp. NPDC001941]|uniref:hypothetical protein n=1 Tax=Streptomyces sp. NPDC001941 TaxID=3154659 RepID=UPI00332249F3
MNSTREAAELLTALADAAARFRQAGYAIFLRHQHDTRWRQFSSYGGSDGEPCAVVGFLISFQDDRDLCVSAVVTATPDGLTVGADITIDSDETETARGEHLTYLLELPDVVTTTMPECTATLDDYVRQLTDAAPGLADQVLARTRPGR